MDRSPSFRIALASFEKNLKQKFLKFERVVDADFPAKSYDVFNAFTAKNRYVIKYDRTGYEYKIYKNILAKSNWPVPFCLDALETDEGVWFLLSFVGSKSLLGGALQQYCRMAESLAGIHNQLADCAIPAAGGFLKDKRACLKEKLAFIEQTKDLTAEIKIKIQDAAMRLSVAPMTIIHDDLLPINIIAAGGNIFFIDWATAGHGACVHDLGRLLGDLKDSRQSYWVKPQWRQKILQVYYDNKKNDRDYTFRDFRTDFQCACLWNYAEIIIAHLKNNWQRGDWYKANLQAIEDNVY